MRPRSLRRLVPLLAVTALALSSCGGLARDGATFTVGSDGDGDAGQLQEQAVEIQGVESCRALSLLETSTASPPPGGTIAPMTLPCLTPGPAVDLAQLRGELVVVNLWASWCGPCREEMPILEQAHQDYGDQVQFVGVATRDGAENAAAFIEDVGVTYPQLADVDAELLKSLRIPGIPVTVILGPDGTLVHKQIGAFEGHELDSLLARLVLEG